MTFVMNLMFFLTWMCTACALFPLQLLFALPYAPAVCRKHRCRSEWGLTFLVLFIGFFRIGEASNPGPAVQFENCHFTLGACNPSGLRNKAHYFCSQLSEGDICAISETHFYGRDVPNFRAGLRAVSADHAYFVPDNRSMQPCSTTHQAWKGVGVLSKHPTRCLPNGLPDAVLNSGRALLTTTLVSDAWISGGVVYGEPDGHRYPHHLRNTEYLLHHVASHVCHLSTGFRYVAGDWNVLQDTLPAFDILTQAGFREIQDLALDLWGTPISNTCKNDTRKDFLYLSPELQEILVGAHVIHDVWPDHAVLVAKFCSPMAMPEVCTWPSPQVFPWPKHFEGPIEWDSSEDRTLAYQRLWQQIESAAAEVCPFPIPAQCLGRAQRLHRKQAKMAQFAPVKAGRKGDWQPQFYGTSRRHAQWTRQVRRLQSFARLSGSLSDHAAVQRAETWGAICRASGFTPDFPTWWSQMEFRTGGAPAICPTCPPTSVEAWAMFDSMAMALRHLEGLLAKQSRQYTRFRRCQNPNLVFSDIRPSAVPGVDLLLQPIRATVEEVCCEEGKITLENSCDFHPERPIVCDGQPLQVIHHEEDAIWIHDIERIPVGAQVSQTRMIGTHQDLSRVFLDAWRERWMRHQDVPASRWEVITAFAKAHMPAGQFGWESMSPPVLRKVIRQKKKSTSHGLDGVRLADLLCMPEAILQSFCSLFATAETRGCWPDQLVHGKVVSLAKVPTPGSPSDFRPITIFGLLYRCWSSFHARKALSALETCLPDTLYGSRSGRHATQVWSKLLWTLEWSYQHDVQLSGLVLDLQKAFNLLPRLAVFEIASHMGLPGNVLFGWAGALTQMKRYFVLRRTLSAGIPSVTGFPEGCGLSCVAMVLVDAAFHRWQAVFFPLCTSLSYVDDWQVLCGHPALVSGARQSLDRFIHAMDLKIDHKKTYTWSISPQGRQLLRAQGSQVVLSAKNLGAHIQMSRKHTNATLMERVQGMKPIWPKLRLSACSYATKVRALVVAAWPRALHAISATTISDAAYHGLRAGAMKGLAADGSGCNAWVQLGLIENPKVDPQFWALVQTIRCIRDCAEPCQVVPRLIAYAHGDEKLPDNGITATLVTRMQFVGWHISMSGLVRDLVGHFLFLMQACLKLFSEPS